MEKKFSLLGNENSAPLAPDARHLTPDALRVRLRARAGLTGKSRAEAQRPGRMGGGTGTYAGVRPFFSEIFIGA